MQLREYKLRDIAEIITGVSYTPDDITTSGIRILRGGNIQAETVLLKDDDVFLPMSYANNNQLKKYDTIIVSSTGSVDALAKGATIFEDLPNTQIGAFLRIIRPKEEKYAMIISMWCTSPFFRQYMIKKAKGTSINNIRTDFLTDFPILVPEDKNLEHTSSLYLNLESKLLLNRQINQNLEALARQLYDYWFVQFDFPNGEGKPYKSSGGKMVYNPILKREIPEGWEMKKLGELCYFSNGINYDKTIEGDTNYKIVNVRNISSSSMLIDSEDLDSICLPSKQAKNYLIEKNAILIARSGVPGATRIVEDVLDCIYCGFIIKCLPHNQLLRLYLTFLLKQFEGTTLTQTGGSILKNVSQETLKSICIVVPSEEILKTFDTQIQTIIDTMNLQINQIASLTKQRDELLPLLMNGQVNFDLSAY